MDENLSLSKKFTPLQILLYALPTVFTMIFMSTYMIIDGMFVARYIGEDAFAAINIIYPLISTILAISLMLSIGSSAVIGKLQGEGHLKKSQEFFTQIYVIGITLGGFVTLSSLLFTEELLKILQISNSLYALGKEYLIYYALFFIPAVLQVFTQSFFVSNGKPFLGFTVCFLGGITNIFLDYLLIAHLQLGIKGASIATGIGFAVPGLFGLLYFATQKNSPLHFVKFKWDIPNLLQSCSNGMSEFVTNFALAITTFLFNIIMLEIAGESGVASITAILYIQMFQMAIYVGFSLGVSPLISFKYGAEDWNQLKEIRKTSFLFISISSLTIIALSYLLGEIAIQIFIPKSSPTFPIALHGLMIFSTAYLFMGINVFMSSLFTALSNGKISATLSCSRTLVFIVFCLLTLPHFLKIDGVWLAVPIAELLSLFLSFYFYKKYQSKYHY